MSSLRLSAPDISPVDEVMEMVHVIVRAVIALFAVLRGGGRRREGLPPTTARWDDDRGLL